MYNNQFMIDNLSRQRERLDDMIKNYQAIPQTPINVLPDNLYEIKKLNDNDEVENIAIFKDTIFIGEDRMQIKKLDGTIEKYDIKRTYPRDKKDDKIDELNKKIEELEEKLSGSKTSNAITKTIETSTRQEQDVEINDRDKPKSSRSIQKS